MSSQSRRSSWSELLKWTSGTWMPRPHSGSGGTRNLVSLGFFENLKHIRQQYKQQVVLRSCNRNNHRERKQVTTHCFQYCPIMPYALQYKRYSSIWVRMFFGLVCEAYLHTSVVLPATHHCLTFLLSVSVWGKTPLNFLKSPDYFH